MKIYVASSWRNAIQPTVVTALRERGHEVYDFRHPLPGDDGFHWSAIDPEWQEWSPQRFRVALEHPIARHGFGSDFSAMRWADAFVMVMPCGRSAHLEAGWAMGMGKPTAILLSDGEPELMYSMADLLATDVDEVIYWLDAPHGQMRLRNPDPVGKARWCPSCKGWLHEPAPSEDPIAIGHGEYCGTCMSRVELRPIREMREQLDEARAALRKQGRLIDCPVCHSKVTIER